MAGRGRAAHLRVSFSCARGGDRRGVRAKGRAAKGLRPPPAPPHSLSDARVCVCLAPPTPPLCARARTRRPVTRAPRPTRRGSYLSGRATHARARARAPPARRRQNHTKNAVAPTGRVRHLPAAGHPALGQRGGGRPAPGVPGRAPPVRADQPQRGMDEPGEEEGGSAGEEEGGRAFPRRCRRPLPSFFSAAWEGPPLGPAAPSRLTHASPPLLLSLFSPSSQRPSPGPSCPSSCCSPGWPRPPPWATRRGPPGRLSTSRTRPSPSTCCTGPRARPCRRTRASMTR